MSALPRVGVIGLGHWGPNLIANRTHMPMKVRTEIR